jgi:hypothetical protein
MMSRMKFDAEAETDGEEDALREIAILRMVGVGRLIDCCVFDNRINELNARREMQFAGKRAKVGEVDSYRGVDVGRGRWGRLRARLWIEKRTQSEI